MQIPFCPFILTECRTLKVIEAIQHKAMNRQFEQIGQTHLMEWPDLGCRYGTVLNPEYVLIFL
ncbi:MAG: hypothetical protein JWM59_4606 [Verrucomicrobiales bacterium]|nr:hypothetical protein [Verrucomicrobiales bacterium]